MPTLHQPKINFTQVSNCVLFDRNVSLKAKGLYSYLRAKPDNYQFSAERIAFETSDGVRSIWSGMKELEETKYIYRHRTASGHFDYFIFNNPKECDEFTSENQIKIKTQEKTKVDINQSNEPYIQNSSEAIKGINPPYIQNSSLLKQQSAKTAVINNTELINNTENKTTTEEVVVEKIIKEFKEIGFSEKQIINFSEKFSFDKMELVLIEFKLVEIKVKYPIGWIIRALQAYDLSRAKKIKKEQDNQLELENLEKELERKEREEQKKTKLLEQLQIEAQTQWIIQNPEKYTECINKAFAKAKENSFYINMIRNKSLESGVSEIEYFKQSAFYKHLILDEVQIQMPDKMALF